MSDNQPFFYRDGENYDLENSEFKNDIPLYLEFASAVSGEVLDIACGTGRITIPIAKNGKRFISPLLA